ncbi:hypothetical protein KUTeg_019936 [Tegillarca granosa]|uniref:Uncharacterized protein n=1 Tax=Tegillarca granosa TaxID=220873 RepID=A0ABQ9EJG4_TEGGR|nr:hypothetical protein KUTeg_019936 [Tegillarca granosa]
MFYFILLYSTLFIVVREFRRFKIGGCNTFLYFSKISFIFFNNWRQIRTINFGADIIHVLSIFVFQEKKKNKEKEKEKKEKYINKNQHLHVFIRHVHVIFGINIFIYDTNQS